VIIAGLLIWQVVPADPPAEGPIDSIAVLPFRNDTGDSNADYLCSEIPASLSAKLSELRDLRVIPTSNLSRFRDQEVEAPVAASQLRVRAVLQGRVLQVGEQLSIGVELVDGMQNRVLWGESYHRPFSDVFEIQEEIVENVARGLRLELTGEERAGLSQTTTRSPEAYESYLKGNVLMEQSARNEDEIISGRKPYDIAASYAYAGEKDLAFEWLSKAYELPVRYPVMTDFRFDSLREDPRYVQLLRKLNLPEEVINRHLKAAY
jgi:TolB-like protein